MAELPPFLNVFFGLPGSSCEHRRAVDRAIPEDLSFSTVTITPIDGKSYSMPVKSAAISFIARWCFDCGAALSGPSPSPLEELELSALAVNTFGLSARELRAAEVAICQRLAGGFFAGGKVRR